MINLIIHVVYMILYHGRTRIIKWV